MSMPVLKLRQVVGFPGNIVGGIGIDATKANGTVTVDTDWSDFSSISAIPTSPTSYILTFDSATGVYVLVPSHLLGGAVAGIADAPTDGPQYGRQLDPLGSGHNTWTAIAGGNFLQAGSGAVTRTMQNKARDFVSVLDYGADNTGATDAAAAIIAADNAASGLGCALYFPKGTYKWILGTYHAKNNSVSWYANKDATISFTANASITGAPISGCPSNCEIRGLKFDGTATFVTGTSHLAHMLYFASVPLSSLFVINLGIEDCEFRGIDQTAVVVEGPTNFRFNRNYVEKTAGSAPTLITEAVWVRDGIIVNDPTVAGPTNNVQVCDNTFVNAGCELGGNKIVAMRNHISGWNYGGGVSGTCTNSQVAFNKCFNSFGVDVNGVYPSGIEFYGTNNIISGNECSGNSGNGIHCGGQNSVLVGNVCYNNGQLASTYGGNPVYTYMHSGAGIVARFEADVINPSGASGSMISGNRCYDNQTTKTQSYGFAADASVTNISLGTNAFGGNKLGATSGTAFWQTSSPTPVPTAPGTGFAATATIRYKQVGDLVAIQGKVSITTIGTATGRLKVPLPIPSNMAMLSVFTAYNQSALTTLFAQVFDAADNVSISLAGAADGHVLTFAGSYESA